MADYTQHYYVAFRLDTDRHNAVVDAGKQIASMRQRFNERFSTQPADVLVGPYYVGSVLLVPSGYVYMQLPERREKTSADGAMFSTGYENRA
jgi:hypothetical protein